MNSDCGLELFEYESDERGIIILGFGDEGEYSSCEHLVIPEGVAVIGDCAFGESSLKSIVFPKSLTEIDDDAFFDCAALESISFHQDSRLKRIGDSAFSGTGLFEITLPPSLTEIEDNAFSDCKSLRSADLCPRGRMKHLGDEAFSGCDRLERVVLPRGLTEISESAFEGCGWLAHLDFGLEPSLRIIGDSAFAGTDIAHLVLPATITEIGDNAFSGCRNLKTVNFAWLKSLRRIGSEAFSGCELLGRAPLPDGLVSLGFEAFSGCSSLSFVGLPASLKEVESEVFSGCCSLTQINADFGAIPKSFDEDFLDGCDATVSFFPNGKGYTPMSKLMLAPYPYKEGKYTLLGPAEWGIERLDLHPAIEEISRQAFKDELRLKSLRVNNSYIAIGNAAFYGCDALEDVELTDGYLCENAFFGSGVKRAIMVKGMDYSAYSHSAVESIALSEGFTGNRSIMPYTFSATRIVDLTVPDELGNIGHHAFFECHRLKRIDLNKVTTIGNDAFASCDSLEEIIFPKGTVSVGERAFRDCRMLEQVDIAEGVRISQQMFYSCTSLAEVVIRGKREYIFTDAFALCPIRRLEFKDMRFSDLSSDIYEMIDTFIGNCGDTLTVVFKDKIIKKTR